MREVTEERLGVLVVYERLDGSNYGSELHFCTANWSILGNDFDSEWDMAEGRYSHSSMLISTTPVHYRSICEAIFIRPRNCIDALLQ